MPRPLQAGTPINSPIFNRKKRESKIRQLMTSLYLGPEVTIKNSYCTATKIPPNTDSTDSTVWCQSLDNKKHMNNMQKVVVLDRLNEGRNLLLTSKTLPLCKDTMLKIRNKNSQKRNCTHGLSPNFHFHVSVSDLYIPSIGPHIFLQQNRQTEHRSI